MSMASSTNKMASVKSAIKSLYGSKLGKILPILVVAGLVATASASIFVNYYGSATVTAQNNDVSFVLGGDNTVGGCTNTPCVSTALNTPPDFATISMNLGIESTASPQPSTTFTDPLQLHNAGSAARSVTITITSATPSTNFYGSVSVYYCTVQSTTPATDVTHCTGSTMTTGFTAPGTVASGVSLAAAGSGYIEFVGYAGSSAVAGTDTLAFNLQVQWA